jgi:hypothetical protein
MSLALLKMCFSRKLVLVSGVRRIRLRDKSSSMDPKLESSKEEVSKEEIELKMEEDKLPKKRGRPRKSTSVSLEPSKEVLEMTPVLDPNQEVQKEEISKSEKNYLC